jgi:hypothetical protein
MLWISQSINRLHPNPLRDQQEKIMSGLAAINGNRASAIGNSPSPLGGSPTQQTQQILIEMLELIQQLIEAQGSGGTGNSNAAPSQASGMPGGDSLPATSGMPGGGSLPASGGQTGGERPAGRLDARVWLPGAA